MKKRLLILRLFFKNKSLVIFSAAIYLLLFTYLVLYVATSINSSYLYFLKDTLMLAQPFFIAILFLAYEFFYMPKLSSCQECISAMEKGKKKLFLGQFLIMLGISFLFCITIFGIHIVAIGLAYGLRIILHIGLNILLNFFLPSVVAILLGGITALALNRISAYFVLFLFVLITGPTFGNLFTGTNAYPLFDFFNFYPYLKFMPNHGFGFSLLPYRWAKVMFWIFAFTAVLFFKVKGNARKSSLWISGVCIAASLCMIFICVQPVSKVDMSEHYQLEELNYYTKHKPKVKEADFAILKYDIQFDIGQLLKADAEIFVDQTGLDQYIFTLYHGYHIQEVTDQNGNPLPFIREGDYLTVQIHKLTPISSIKMKYKGYSHTFYSNFQGIYLSGAFPYYPKPGFYNIYNENMQSYRYAIAHEASDFRVQFTGSSDQVWSNLDRQKDGTFVGRSNGAVFLKGFYTSKTVDGVQCVYPYLASELITEPVIKEEIENWLESSVYKNTLTQIFSTPNMNQYGYAPVCADFMETLGITSLRKNYETFFVTENKRELYEAYYLYLHDKEMFYSSAKDELSEEYPYEIMANPLLKAVNHLGEENALNAIEDYLFDSNRTEQPSTFLQTLVS